MGKESQREWGKADGGGGDCDRGGGGGGGGGGVVGGCGGSRRVCVEDLRLVCWRISRGAVRTNTTVIVGAKMLI